MDDAAEVLAVLEKLYPVGTRVRVKAGFSGITPEWLVGSIGVVVRHNLSREFSHEIRADRNGEEYVFTFEELEPV